MMNAGFLRAGSLSLLPLWVGTKSLQLPRNQKTGFPALLTSQTIILTRRQKGKKIKVFKMFSMKKCQFILEDPKIVFGIALILWKFTE